MLRTFAKRSIPISSSSLSHFEFLFGIFQRFIHLHLISAHCCCCYIPHFTPFCMENSFQQFWLVVVASVRKKTQTNCFHSFFFVFFSIPLIVLNCVSGSHDATMGGHWNFNATYFALSNFFLLFVLKIVYKLLCPMRRRKFLHLLNDCIRYDSLESFQQNANWTAQRWIVRIYFK